MNPGALTLAAAAGIVTFEVFLTHRMQGQATAALSSSTGALVAEQAGT